MNELVTLPEDGQEAFSESKIELIKSQIAPGISDDQLELFLHQAKRTRLDPLAKQIHAVLRWNSKMRRNDMSIQVSIDGYRLIADRTGRYAGNDDYLFNDNETQFQLMQHSKYPQTATATVYKIVTNIRVPFSATAAWESYYPGDGPAGFFWRKMPYLMLGKCAEALALRKAFPAELSGIYIHEEMQQAGFVDVIEEEDDEPTSYVDHLKPDAEKLVVYKSETEEGTVTVYDAPAAEGDNEETEILSSEAEDDKKEDVSLSFRLAQVLEAYEFLDKKRKESASIGLGIIADAAVMSGEYNDREHVRNTLKLDEDKMTALREKGLKPDDFRQKFSNWRIIFDALMMRDSDIEEMLRQIDGDESDA